MAWDLFSHLKDWRNIVFIIVVLTYVLTVAINIVHSVWGNQWWHNQVSLTQGGLNLIKWCGFIRREIHLKQWLVSIFYCPGIWMQEEHDCLWQFGANVLSWVYGLLWLSQPIWLKQVPITLSQWLLNLLTNQALLLMWQPKRCVTVQNIPSWTSPITW